MPPQYKANNKKKQRALVPYKKPAVPMRYKVADMAYKGFKAAMTLKKLINVEFKHVDFNATISPDFNGTLHFLNDSGQGTSDTTRVGDSILNKHTSIRGKIARGSLNCVVRIIIFKDKTNIMTTPTLLQDTGSVFSPLSMRDRDHRKNYTIIKDITYSLDSERPQLAFDYEFDNNDHTKFEAGSLTINTNSYRVLFISDQVGGASAPIITYTRRHSFVDN